MNSLPKQVISRGRPELTWNAQLLDGDDLVSSVRALKQREDATSSSSGPAKPT